MNDLTIRGLDQATLARLAKRARERHTSVEVIAKEAVVSAFQLSVEEKLALVHRMQAITERLKVPGVRQTPAEELIRESRDFDH